LAAFDTTGALAYLSAQEQSEDAVDAGLVAVLREIAQNLDKYRPHLPNYVKGGAADDIIHTSGLAPDFMINIRVSK